VVDDPNPSEVGSAVVPKQEDQPPNDSTTDATKTEPQQGEEKDPKSSKYAMSSHSGEIVREDIYISDGSEDEDEDVDVILAASRSGMMRRGMVTPAAMIQPNRQWVRPGEDKDATDKEAEEKQREEELAALDPVQRAARLQAEKARLEQQEKEEERAKESQENAGRDPTMFSRRTAFDIRFDQMEDKPWLRASDISDFFNYGLDEEGWLEYAQQQLMIRQELTDAARNKRAPDPNLVPVTPRAPSSQAPRVAVVGHTSDDKNDDMMDEEHEDKQPGESNAPLGPSLPADGVVPKNEGGGALGDAAADAADDVDAGVGGAWGAGAVPGSHLARLIEEQEQREKQPESNTASASTNNGIAEGSGGMDGGRYGHGDGGSREQYGQHAYASGGAEPNHYGGRDDHDQYGRHDSSHNGPTENDGRYQNNEYGPSGQYGSTNDSYSHEAPHTDTEASGRGRSNHYGSERNAGGGGYYDSGGGGGGQWNSTGEEQYGGGSYNNNRRGHGRGRYGGGGGGYGGNYNSHNNNSWDHHGREDYGRKRNREWRR